MITKAQRRNAERIKSIADELGHLPYNMHGQTTNSLCNLSIPCAQLICAGIVTGVVDSYDAVNEQAVEDIERHIRVAVERHTNMYGTGWWTEAASRLELA